MTRRLKAKGIPIHEYPEDLMTVNKTDEENEYNLLKANIDNAKEGRNSQVNGVGQNS